ncbi:MAG: type 1 glutamine amidotransferase [Cellulomonadaceae bacterium]
MCPDLAPHAASPAGPTVLVLRHLPVEGPGLIGTALDLRGVPWHERTVLDDASPELPDPRTLAGLVVMGGTPGALDDAQHPGLAAERALLAEATAADVPVLGVCLGMQLLAVALGASLHPRHGTEIGFAPVAISADGIRDAALYPLVVDATADPEVLHWHDDAVDAPVGAAVLASTPTTPVQAFRLGSAVGLQFHLEVDEPLLTRWLTDPDMTAGASAAQVEAVRAGGARRLPSLAPRGLVAFDTFAQAARARRG